jgi:hypothetical protein
MKLTVDPELILWEFIATRLGERNETHLTQESHFKHFPPRVEVSEGFLAGWRQTVQALIGREVTRMFGLRTLPIIEHDQVRHVSIADPAFWSSFDLGFSHRAIDRLWEALMGEARPSPPTWLLATPADALVLAALIPESRPQYSFAWLRTNQAPWVVLAWFVLTGMWHNPVSLPWRGLLVHPETLPLPMRVILLEQSARFFRVYGDALEAVFTTENRRDENGAVLGREPRLSFLFHSSDRGRFDLVAGDLGQEDIRQAVTTWTGSGMLGYDDDRVIHDIVDRTGLFGQIDRLDRLHREIVAVRTALETEKGSDE